MAEVLIVKAGTTVPGVARRRQDFEHWIAAGLGLPHDRVRVCRVFEGEALPKPQSLPAVVVTGSAAMVTTREAWSERTADWLREAVHARAPLLGICYGHQLLAHALGGTVDDNPQGRHIGTVDVTLTRAAEEDRLFSGFEPVLHLPVSHRQSVTELPKGARRLAFAERDPNHAFAASDRAWGVQFHPEFEADIVRGYIEERRAQIESEGLDADRLHAAAKDTLHGTLLLRRFAHLLRIGF